MESHKKAEWRNCISLLQDGSYIDRCGDICYIKGGKRHREDGPAVILHNGDRFWYEDDSFHRLDGPAVERANGMREWYVNGLMHRKDGPAKEWPNGMREWYLMDVFQKSEVNGVMRWYYRGEFFTSEKKYNKAVLKNRIDSVLG